MNNKKFNILNRSLDIWEFKNLTKEEAEEKLSYLNKKEFYKSSDEWKYDFEVIEVNN